MPLACFIGAGAAALIGAVGATLTSVPAIHGQLGIDPDPYWNNRLLANLILAATGLFFGAAIILLGAYLAASHDPGRAVGGSLLLLASILPQVVSIVAVPVLTPSDWTHTIPPPRFGRPADRRPAPALAVGDVVDEAHEPVGRSGRPALHSSSADRLPAPADALN